MDQNMDPAISVGEPWMWAAFVALALVMLALDLFAFGDGKAQKISLREAALSSLAWFGLARRRPVVASLGYGRAGGRRPLPPAEARPGPWCPLSSAPA
jgi:hypothetical protein